MTRIVDFQGVFSHLCHVAALSRHGKTQAIIDSIVLTTIALETDQDIRSPSNVVAAIRSRFGLSFREMEVIPSIDRALTLRSLVRNRQSGRLTASPAIEAQVKTQRSKAAVLESSVRAEWLESIADSILEKPSNWEEQLWDALRMYMASAFRRHGIETTQLLRPTVAPSQDDQKRLGTYLNEAIQAHCEAILHEPAESAIREFFLNSTSLRTDYLAQLLDSTFSFFALTIDDATAEYLRGEVSRLTLFLDTNFILGILNIRSNPLNDISQELLDVIKTGKFPFDLYYHESTLSELQHVIRTRAGKLRGKPWQPSVSRAASNSGQVSGLELQYHQANAESPIDVDVFLSRYEHLTDLLSEYGFRLYSPATASQNILDERAELVKKYQTFLNEEMPFSAKHVGTLTHDMAVWQTIKQMRGSGSSIITAGAFFLSVDRRLYEFDWLTLRGENVLGCVLLPNQLLQLLRPFLPKTDDFNRRFVESFAIPEFRVMGGNYSDTVSLTLGFFNAYKGIGESTATRMLANEVLIHEIHEHRDDAEKIQALIDNELTKDNSQLLDLNKDLHEHITNLQKEIQQAQQRAREHEDAARSSNKEVEEARRQVAELMARVSALERSQAPAEGQPSVQHEDSQLPSEIVRMKRILLASLLGMVALGNLIAYLAIPRLDRLWGALIFSLEAIGILVFAPFLLSWKQLSNHPNKHGLYVTAVIIIGGVTWAIADPERQGWAIGSAAIVGALLVIGQIIGNVSPRK